jgi:hypothetical protein
MTRPYGTQAFMMGRLAEALWGAAASFEKKLTRLRGGGVEAVAALMERFQHRLYRYLLRIVREQGS